MYDPFGMVTTKFFLFALPGKILFQFPAQLPGLHADDGVLARVETGTPAEDFNPDLLFRYLVCFVDQKALGDVQQKTAKLSGSRQAWAGGNSVDQAPSGITLQGIRIGSRLSG